MRLFKPVSVCVLLTVVLGGCGHNDQQVSFKSGGVTHTFTEGQAATKGFPLPIYPNSQPTGAVEAKGDSSEDSDFMMLSSTDPPEKIGQFYTDKLKADGWTVEQNSFAPKVMKLDAHKKGLEASVMLSGDDKQTSISLAISKEVEGTPKITGQDFTPDKLNPPTD